MSDVPLDGSLDARAALPLVTINAGSSSVRLARFDGPDLVPNDSAKSDDAGDPEALLRGYMDGPGCPPPRAVVHRLVHGGHRFSGPVRIDDGVRSALEELVPLAPLHLPKALEFVRVAQRLLPSATQVAVFDTAFFRDLPEVAATYALPRALMQRLGLRRFGFHGLAHAAMWQAFAAATGRVIGRVVTLQLGSGCSAAALRDGRPLDTSMGFTPTEGLVMATRSGDLDPGLITHLARTEGLDPDALDRLLTTRSGLAGLSEMGADVRRLLESEAPGPRLAVATFAYRVRKYLGAYAAVLGGLDGIVFGGGIGENSPKMRARCLENLDFLGVALDPARNQAARGTAEIGRTGAPVRLLVVAVDEAREMARQALGILARPGPAA